MKNNAFPKVLILGLKEFTIFKRIQMKLTPFTAIIFPGDVLDYRGLEVQRTLNQNLLLVLK